MGAEQHVTVVIIGIFLITNGVEHIFVYLCHVSYFVKHCSCFLPILKLDCLFIIDLYFFIYSGYKSFTTYAQYIVSLVCDLSFHYLNVFIS